MPRRGVTQCMAAAPAGLAQVGHRLLQVHAGGGGRVGVLPAVALAGVICLGGGTGEAVMQRPMHLLVPRLPPSPDKLPLQSPLRLSHPPQLSSAPTLHDPAPKRSLTFPLCAAPARGGPCISLMQLSTLLLLPPLPIHGSAPTPASRAQPSTPLLHPMPMHFFAPLLHAPPSSAPSSCTLSPCMSLQ